MAIHSKRPVQRLFSQFLLLWLISAIGIWRNNFSIWDNNPAIEGSKTRTKAATTTIMTGQRLKRLDIQTGPSNPNQAAITTMTGQILKRLDIQTGPSKTNQAAITTMTGQRLKRLDIQAGPSITNQAARNVTVHRVDTAISKSVVNQTGLPQHLQGVRRIFTGGRHDRSGAAVLFALKGHAYARTWGLEYGGVCHDTDQTPIHESMVQALGLSQEITFHACPTKGDPSQVQISGIEFSPKLQENFSKEWWTYMQSQIRRRATTHNATGSKSTHNDASKEQSPLQVAVHVRRGDVSPCTGNYDRFLPNQHYLQVIKKYVLDPSRMTNRPINITFFSESSDTVYEPLESLVLVNGSDGANKSYTVTTHLALDSPITEVWQQMMDSDVLILSKSSFAFIPALLSTRLSRIIFTPWGKHSPNKQYPMDHWEIVDSAIVDQSTAMMEEMKKRLCPKTLPQT